MDSKLKRRTIAVCVLLLLVFAALILGFNYLQGGFGNRTGGTSDRPDGSQNTADGSLTPGTVYGDSLTEEQLHAFVSDATFFDEDPVESIVVDASNYVRVTMSIHSVLNDLRIQILNSNDELVTGVAFVVTVDGEEYTDMDLDGLIVINNLPAKEYEVRLNELEGYRVPVAAMRIKVMDVLAYEYIPDIDLFITSEEDVNRLEEDTGVHFVDADTTEMIDTLMAEEDVKLGIDVSSWNGEIDWTAVQAAGIEFAMIRCGYRGMTDGELVEDAYFRQNVEDALAVGLQVGVYFSSQAVDEREAVEEASMAIRLCREYAVTYPVFILQESSFGANGIIARADGLESAERTEVVSAFCQTMENAGFRTGVSATNSWFTQELTMSALTKYYVYLSEFRSEPEFTGEYVFWHYSDSGWIDGVTGRVGMVISYYEY